MAVRRPDPAKEFRAALRTHRATLDRLLDRRSVIALRRLYDRAQDELTRKLAKQVSMGRQDSMSALQAQQLLMQVREAQQVIAARLAQGMAPISREVQGEGIHQVSATLTRLEAAYTGATITLPLEEAATFAGIIERRAPSLIRANESSWLRYGQRLTTRIEQELAVSLATGETPIEAIEKVRAITDSEWWQGERIVRTELAHAYNSAHADSIEVAAKELRDLSKRWCEHVDDSTGRPLDDRVAVDSLVLHGQVVSDSGLFVMPSDNRISAKLWNKTFRNGPNRPNDRSVTMPWRPHWGIPGWVWKNGERQPVKQDTRTLDDLLVESRRLADLDRMLP